MFARNLEQVLQTLTQGGDFRAYAPKNMEERFDSLRSYGKLPRGRQRRGQHLTPSELAAVVFSLVPANPKWAGEAACLFEGLRPIGGTGASFAGAPTLSAALQMLLTDSEIAKRCLDVTVSAAEFGTNNSGFASLRFREGDGVRTAHFISKLAASLLQPGAEATFHPESFRAAFSRAVVFDARFFSTLRREVEVSLIDIGEPAGDGSEYDEEEARQARFQRLGATPASHFLHFAVDTQVTWPKEETLVPFDRYRLVLMPRTKEHTQSVHIDLAANRLSDEEAITVINRFLSLLSWCDDKFAVAQHGWSGNPVPVTVSKRDLAFSTAHYWAFNRDIPTSEKVLRTLGHYREGRNAEEAGLAGYAVLSYYKVLEVDRKTSDKIKNWIIRTYPSIAQAHASDPAFAAFLAALGTDTPENYLHEACRVAAAHASVKFPSDVDDRREVRRLYVAAAVLRALARRMIGHDLRVSDDYWQPPATNI